MKNQGAVVDRNGMDRFAWWPPNEREIAIELVMEELRALQHELEAMHGRVQVIGKMLELSGGDSDGKTHPKD
jgi:hypothetical protein